jgi:uncharacterized protein YndB with AHSA1/START domain
MFKKILIGVVIVIGLILLFALTKPASFSVVRTTTVKAPPEAIYPFLDDFHKWSAWSPWEKMDPSMNRSYEGPQNGKGAVYAWDGNGQVGKGRMEITDAVPSSKVDLNLDFTAPMETHNKVEFALTPHGDSTEVTWTMSGDNNYLSKVMQVFVSMDSMVGGDFESGLRDLKASAEKAASSTPPAATP